ncbi:M48 family metallopeptidase [Candidatus Kapabacteria bacterium]|nr:M48 family metallopeptidase [Candidatus Kapabacteria bacterium]
MKKSILTSIIILLTLMGCSRVPITGRKQFNIIPKNTLLSQSFNSYNSFLNENKVIKNTKDAILVKKVGNRIKNSVINYMKQKGLSKELESFKWEFNLVESNDINAWCMPGGKVVFYTGILKYTMNEAGIATVMGHEIAHAIAKHGAERMSQTLVKSFGGLALNEFMEQKGVEGRNYWMAAYGAGTSLGFSLPFSRLHETEADNLGLVFMAMAGYNPNEAVKFWERMSKGKSGGSPEFLSTHPSHKTRIKNLKKEIPKVMKYYN